MPGPGTGEWDGGWSMFTLLLPAEHIPSTESWRLFNLQILKQQQFPSGESSHNDTDLIVLNFMKCFRIRPLNLAKVMLKSSAGAKSMNGMKNVFFSWDYFFSMAFLSFYSVADSRDRQETRGKTWGVRGG